MARKGKYHQWVEEEGLTLIEGWARSGLSDEQIAHNMGIVPKTLYEWKNKYSDISKAIKKGKEVSDFEVENALYKRALGYEVEETKTYMKDTGFGMEVERVEKTKKHVAGDTTAMIFWLKNRKRNDWNENYHLEHSGTVDISSQSDIFTKYLTEDDNDDS